MSATRWRDRRGTCGSRAARYRFTAEPTLNKVVMEREGAIADARVRQLVREAVGSVATGPRRAQGDPPR